MRSLSQFFIPFFLVVGVIVILTGRLLGEEVNDSVKASRLVGLNLAEGLKEVTLLREKVILEGKNAAQSFLVLARDHRGLEVDITSECIFSVSNDQLAQVSKRGRLTSKANGHLTLRADIAGQRLTAPIFIKNTDLEKSFSFPREIVGVFTRNGCNGSECHGGVKGRGGFKLSLHGINPQEDYRWTVKGGIYQVLSPKALEPFQPRINLSTPNQSLLLLKPTMAVSHGGGQRFETDSDDYKILLDWISRGGRYASDSQLAISPQIEQLKVFPKEIIMEPGVKRKLLVMGHFTDGRVEDLTPEVLYESSNPEVANVTADGFVQAVNPGQTLVTVRTLGKIVHVQCGVIGQLLLDYPEISKQNFIDKYIFSKLKKLHILPSGISNDSEFLRRVCLDLTGMLPPPERVREFIVNQDPRKRRKLIEQLLDSPEFVDYWTFRFADFFRVVYRNAYSYKKWIRQSLVQNKPYDQMARERIAGQGNTGATRHYIKSVSGEMMLPHEKMGEDVRVFLGIRLDCAQCHDHPYEPWAQDQFWGLTSFYGQLTRIRNGSVFFDDPAGNEERPEGSRVIHPRRREEVSPKFLDGTSIDRLVGDPRGKLANWMTSSNNPYFSRAIVNRIWSYFFQRGIVEPVDDFRPSNPPTHPELLDALASEFRRSGYDIRRLMRVITQSRTYQLSSDPNKTNEEDKVNYSRALPRRLDAEILLDAISQVTGVPEIFPVHKYVGGGSEPTGTRAIHLVPEVTPSQFLEVFGRPISRDNMPWRDRRATLRQALHLLVGSTYGSKISAKGGRVDLFLKNGVSDRQIIENLYLAAFSRYPTTKEYRELGVLIKKASSPKKGIENLTWGLLASREFTYNH